MAVFHPLLAFLLPLVGVVVVVDDDDDVVVVDLDPA